jgi:unsaturated rhamnogalacturonyl hydrolase
LKSRVNERNHFLRMTINKLLSVYSMLGCATLVAVLTSGQSAAQSSAVPGSASANLPWPNADKVRGQMKAAFTSGLKPVLELAPKLDPKGDWVLAVFYIGVSAAWQATADKDYHNAIVQWGQSRHWQPAPRPRHADDLACGQVYLELYQREGGPERIAAIRKRVDAFLASPQPGHVDWWWCDAFFMAPPVFVKLSAATGDAHYREAMHPLYWDAVAALWNEPNHLFYRDSRYLGTQVFWGRGNGWVLAGLARILDVLPADDPARPRYEALFKTMAARVVQLQGEDGAWRVNLLHPEKSPLPESSSTALFAYGLAWGVNHGLLSRADYAPAVLKAWAALERARLPDGQIGSVQGVGYEPRAAKPTDTAPFGDGAFLLFGSELLPPPPPPAG